MGTSFHLEKNDIKHFKLKLLLRIGVWNVSLTSIDAEKSNFDVLTFLCIWNRYNDFEENCEGHNAM